ncbi:MAG: single-stranded DNA-binding protein [Solirubrobacteraceae bacterium]
MFSTQLTGRLVRDPELRSVPSGATVCELRLAVENMGRDGTAGYIDVASWGPSGEAAARVLRKGWLVAVDGRLRYEEWETDHGKRSAIRVVGRVEFLAAPRNGESPTEVADLEPAGDDDIPF